MIPDKTQELDLRELMARYEQEYGSDAEREFFGQDWSNLVAKCNGADSTAKHDVDSQQVSALTPSVGEWGQAKPRLRDSLLRSGAGLSSRTGRLPRWLSLSLLIGTILSGLGWLTLGGGGETTTTSAPPPSSPEPGSPIAVAFAATAQTHVRQAERAALPLPSASPGETVPGGLPGAGVSRSLDAAQTSLGIRSTPTASETDAESTLARRAVDAVLAGDRARALHLYRELARRAPQSEVYREATRILSRAAAPSSQTPDQRPSPSPGANTAR